MKKIKNILLAAEGATVYDEMDSPVGILTIIASSQGLHAILWDLYRASPEWQKIMDHLQKSDSETIIVQTKKQLTEYFEGKRKTFDLPLKISGTNFQRQAWNQLIAIPYGTTISYAEQAEKIGNKNKARAVGMANGLNPISIVIPCHRVIGSCGRLVGFGGGIEKKAYLLRLEQAAEKSCRR